MCGSTSFVVVVVLVLLPLLSVPGRWIIFRINRKAGKVVIESESDPAEQGSEAAFDNMLEHLTPENCRFGLVKLTYTTEDGRDTEDMALFLWRGAKAKMKPKLIYAGTANTLRQAFSVKTYHEYDNKAELTHAALVARCDK